jgi:hypothetical protein
MTPWASTLSAAALLVLAGLSILWTVVLLSLMGELKRRSERLDGVLRVLEVELPPALTEIREAARSVNRVVQDLGESTPRLRATLTALAEAGENVRGATGAVRNLFGYRFIPVAGILAGLRTGLRYAWRVYRRRES